MKSRTASVETEFITDRVEEISEANRAARTRPRKACRQEFIQQGYECGLAFSAGEQCERNNAGKCKDEDRQKFQHDREHPAPARLVDVPSPQHSLNVYLIDSPIEDTPIES